MIPDTSISGGGCAPARCATTLTASPAVPGRPAGDPCLGRGQLLQVRAAATPGHGRPRCSSPARHLGLAGHHSARAAQSGLKGMLVAIAAPGYALRKVEEKPRIV